MFLLLVYNALKHHMKVHGIFPLAFCTIQVLYSLAYRLRSFRVPPPWNPTLVGG